MATQDERISELNNKIDALNKKIKKNDDENDVYQKDWKMIIGALLCLETLSLFMFISNGDESSTIGSLVCIFITITVGFLILKIGAKLTQKKIDKCRENIRQLYDERKSLKSNCTVHDEDSSVSSCTSREKELLASDNSPADSVLTAVNTARPDIIEKDYWKILPRDYFEYDILNIRSGCSSEGISVNILTGSMKTYTEYLCNRGCYYYTERDESYENITDLTVREFAKRVSEEMGEKFASFTLDKWKEYIPEDSLKHFEETLKSCEIPEVIDVKKPQKHRLTYDFDAYYTVYYGANGTGNGSMAFLRRTDSGWRAFSLSPGHLNLSDNEHNITEQDIINCFKSHNLYGKFNICCDRKLNQQDMEYVSELMPESHPSEAIGRSFASGERFSYNNYTAYYLKGNQWFPCANFKNIEEIYHRISTVAEYEIEYK